MNTEKRLYQWDTGQKLVGCTGLYVDFPIGTEVYRVETTDGMCIIPDELLQTSGGHKVYECMTNNTIRSFAFSVTPRPKPPDYVYTPTERLTFEGLVQKVDDAVADMIRRAESGEFDGYTPVKGKDYFTTAEIQQIQNEVSSGAIGEFKSVVDTETETFNNNAETKLIAYNQNDSEKTASYNANATKKLNAYNANADNRVAEFDAHTEQIQTDVSELKSDIDSIDNKITNKMALLIKPRQLFDKNRVKLGYLAIDGRVYNGGAYDESYYTDYFIDVSEHVGETIYFSFNNALHSARVVTAYDINKKPIASLGTSDKNTYVVPEGVSFVKFTMYTYALSSMQAEFSEITAYQEYFDEYYVANADSIHGILKANQLGLCEKSKCVNRLNPAEVVLGKYISTNGVISSNDSYGLTGIMEVEEGKTYTLQFDNGIISAIQSIGFICAYDADMNVISSSGATHVNEYTVPSGIKYVRIAAVILKTYYEQTQFVPHTAPIRYIDYIEDRYLILNKYLDLDTIKKELEEVKEDVSSGRLETANDGDSISFTVPNIKKNSILSFHANIDTFGTVVIGQGKTSFNETAYAVIDSTTVKIYRYTTEPIEWATLNHNLTFENYIDVSIEKFANDTNYAKLTITSNGETYTYESAFWMGCDRTVYADIVSGSYSNVSLDYTCLDYKADVWAYGDSYFDHWVQYLLNDGYTNFLCDGYSGRASTSAMTSLEKGLEFGKPRKILWCMGMNDKDNSSGVNSNWESIYYKLLDICEKNNIIPILCTIPNVPNINHNYKNEIIRNSGHRYIDLAKAVGSDISTGWYDGLLSTDNVHPSTDGDKMIAKFMRTQLPEIKG